MQFGRRRLISKEPTNKSSLAFDPDRPSPPPGDTIMDILETKKMSVADLATKIGIKEEVVQNVIDGHGIITPWFAAALGRVLGPSEAFWASLERSYRQSVC